MIINLPKIGPVRFREGLSPQEFQSQLGQLSKKYGFEIPKPEMGLGAIASNAFKRSAGEVGIALGDTLPAMAASSLGLDNYARGQMDEAQLSREALEDKYPTRFKSYQDVKGLGDATEFTAETLGELGPSVLTALVPGVGAGAVGTRLAAQAAAKRGLTGAAATQAAQQGGRRAMYGGVYLGSLAQNSPEVFENIYRETDKFEPGVAALAGGISSILDTIVPGQLLDQLGPYGRQKVIAEVAKQSGAAPKAWKYLLGGAASTAAKEGITESAQEAINAQAEKVAGVAKDVLHPDNIQRYKEAFVKGAIGGGAIGTAGGGADFMRARKDVKDTATAQQALAEQEQAQALRENPPADPMQGAMFQESQNAQRAQREQDITAAFDEADAKNKQVQDYYGGAFQNLDDMQAKMRELDNTKAQLAQATPGTPVHNALQENVVALQQLINDRYGRNKAQIEQPGTPIQGQPTTPVEDIPEPTVRQAPPQSQGLGKALDGLDLNNVDDLTKALGIAAKDDTSTNINWTEFENKLNSLPQDVVDEAENRLRGQERTTPLTPQPEVQAQVQEAPVQIEQPPTTSVQLEQPTSTPEQPLAHLTRDDALPELIGRDPNDVNHVADLLRLSENITDKDTIKQINKWAKQVPKDVMSKALQMTEPVDVQDQTQEVAQPTPNLPESDVNALVTGLGDRNRMRGFSEQERSANNYFSKYRDPDMAMKAIANDLVYQDTPYKNTKMKAFEGRDRGMEPMFKNAEEADQFKGQGGQHAKLASDWVNKNLSPETAQKLNKYVDQYKQEKASAEAFIDKNNRERESDNVKTTAPELELVPERNDVLDRVFDNVLRNAGVKRYKASPETAHLHTEAHPSILQTLSEGNLSKALQGLADSGSSQTARRIAEVLRTKLGNVKVKYGTKESSYNPITNTINLREGATEYEILHEGAHAALSHTIDNKNNPTTRQLQDIFNNVKKGFDGQYGATDLQEFVAEVWSNPDFQRQLRETSIPSTQQSNVSIFDRIIDMIRKFLGFPPRKNAFDQVDSLLNEIVSQPPDVRGGETMYAAAMNNKDLADKIQNGISQTIQNMPLMTPDRVNRFMGNVEKVPQGAKSLMYKALNLSALGQVSKKLLGPSAVEFSDTVNLKSGYQENLAGSALLLHKRLQKYAQTPNYQAWSTLVHDSTRNDVNPTAKPDRYKNDPDKLKVYKDVQARYNKLTPDEKKLYNDLFSTYKTLDKEFEKSLESTVLSSIPDEKIARSAYQKVLQHLANLRVDHYAPLYRRGTYWMSYDLNGESFKRLFQSQAELNSEMARLNAAGATNVETYTQLDQLNSQNAPSGTIISSIINSLKDSGVQDKIIDDLAQMIVKTFPETSVLRSRQHREGVAGYLDDAALAFDNVSSTAIHQLAKMKYREPLRRLLANMEGEVNKLRGPDNFTAAQQYNEFLGRYEFVMNPNISNWAQFASTASFFYNLGANVSSAVVNTLQLPLIVQPQLGGEYGQVKAMTALKDAIKLYTHSGLKRRVTDLAGNESVEQAMLSVENLVNDGKTPQYKKLIDALKDHGFLQTSTARDAVVSADKASSTLNQEHKLQYYTTLYGTFMFHHAERMNREVTGIAAYDLEMDKLKGNKDLTQDQKEQQAITKAIRAIEYMHGAGHSDTGPSLGHSDIGKILMVFKRFAFSMYYMLFDTIKRALPNSGLSKDEQNVARRQLAGVYVMSSLFAGAKGLPLYWIAETAYNALLADDDEDDFDAVARKYLGDLPFKGPVNYFTNLSIADRVGWTDLIFREARNDKSDAGALSQIIEGALGAPYTIANNMFRAKELMADGHYQKAVETALPVALRNPLKALRYNNEGVNTLRGDPVMGEVSGYNAGMQALGFAPADVLNQYEENAYLKKTSDKLVKQRDRLMKQYYVAYREGDAERVMELRDKLFEFGSRHPEMGIDDSFINRSMKARDRVSEQMYHGITLPKWVKDSYTKANEEMGPY